MATTRLKSLLRLTLIGLVLQGSAAVAADLTGNWRTIDDKTGFAKSIVKIEKNSAGEYTGTIIRVVPRPDYTPQEICTKCPAPNTNKPIIGLTVLSGLKDDPKKENHFMNGSILDPLSGKVYGAKARVSEDGRRLTMRGYVGVSMLGRSQSWFREEK